MGKCVVLNGASCSGKTSIAKKLLELSPDMVHIEVSKLDSFYKSCFNNSIPMQDDWSINHYTRRSAVNSIMIDMADIFLAQDINVVVDCSFDGGDGLDNMEIMFAMLEEYFPLVIEVTCSEDEFRKRSKLLGKGEKPFEQIGQGIYDDSRPSVLTIDTTDRTEEECANEILEFLVAYEEVERESLEEFLRNEDEQDENQKELDQSYDDLDNKNK